MQKLKSLLSLNEKKLTLDKFPEDVIKKLKKLIRDGATDLQKQWDNSLALVRKAFEVEGVELPTPSERTGFAQFEELLKYAVVELADARKDADSSWRMSSTVFKEMKESMTKTVRVKIIELGDTFGKTHTVQAKNIEEVIEMVKKQAGKKHFDTQVEPHEDGTYLCRFSYQGINRQYKIKIALMVD